MNGRHATRGREGSAPQRPLLGPFMISAVQSLRPVATLACKTGPTACHGSLASRVLTPLLLPAGLASEHLREWASGSCWGPLRRRPDGMQNPPPPAHPARWLGLPLEELLAGALGHLGVKELPSEEAGLPLGDGARARGH